MYYDTDGNLYPKWVDEEALSIANSIVKGDEKPINTAQLRKFYGEFKTLERRLDSGEMFNHILPHIKLAKARVNYAQGRKPPLVPKSFVNWLTKHVNNIEKEKDFRSFLLHFEAVVGFSYGLGLKN